MSIAVNFILYLTAVALLWQEGNWGSFLTAMIFSWVFSVIIGVFSILLTGLVIFHMFLIAIGKTTFLYLMKNKINKIVPVNNELESAI
jgi:ABC-type bacteriocin/lantibiotic exporter with double-glycine peptidase domain